MICLSIDLQDFSSKGNKRGYLSGSSSFAQVYLPVRSMTQQTKQYVKKLCQRRMKHVASECNNNRDQISEVLEASEFLFSQLIFLIDNSAFDWLFIYFLLVASRKKNKQMQYKSQNNWRMKHKNGCHLKCQLNHEIINVCSNVLLSNVIGMYKTEPECGKKISAQ